ncbi:MAG: hypothetical protein K0R24_476 [Gammaproteobacteria bacterium]|jgi:uncharacterized DUF497 family protein|nr:hypothetical protein [Gammaproteobacteria bacterium]
MKHFEWDKQKKATNLDKHGIDFIDAVKIFNDPNRIESSNRFQEEERFQTIGLIHDIVIFVVYTIRKNRKRIISARRASKNEREKYDKEKT